MTTKAVEQSTQMTSHEFARELFRPKGTKYLECALVADALKMKLPKPPPIRFSEAELTLAEARGEQLMYLPRENAKGEPITADLICATLGNQAPLGGLILYGLGQKECWYRDSREGFFFAETVRTRQKEVGSYRLNAVRAIPGTKGVSYLEQTVTGARYVEIEIYSGDLPASLKYLVVEPSERQEEIARATAENWQTGSLMQSTLPFNQFARGNFVEVLMWVVVNQYVNRSCLLETEWAWLVSRSRSGYLVGFGDAGANGAGVGDWYPNDASGDLGFFLSRSETAERES